MLNCRKLFLVSPGRSQQSQQSDERITVISITPHPVSHPARPEQKKKSNLKSPASRFSDQAQQSHYSRTGRARETGSDESNLEEYQIEGESDSSPVVRQ